MTDTARRRIRRSHGVRLSLLGAAAFTVTACEDTQVSTNVFPSVEACYDAAGRDPAWPTRDDCNASFQQALAEHQRAAPRYDEQALCEEEHGGACQAEARPGGGSVFLPLMAGYMIGSMMRGSAASPAAQPVYRASAGGYATASGAARFPSNATSAQLRPASFAAGAATSAAQPMTRATVRSTGGFGQARTSAAGPRVGAGG